MIRKVCISNIYTILSLGLNLSQNTLNETLANAEKLLTAEACHSKNTPQQFNYVNQDQNISQDSDDNEDRNWQSKQTYNESSHNKTPTENEQPEGKFLT